MQAPDRMTPMDIHRLIASEHRDIHAKLDDVSQLAKTLLSAGPSEFTRFLRRASTLFSDLKSQIGLEAKVLLPALRGADAWGNVRADQLIKQLRERRRELRDLRKSAGKREQATLGAEVDRFIDARRIGMAREERDSLHSNVLRDDVIGIDVSGG